MSSKHLVVVGGGAAGFFCAVNAARLNPLLKVTILEKTSKFLSKVRISGGGRCNVTHACFDIGEMSKKYPRGSNFVKKPFHQFFTTDTVRWFEERGVKLKTEADGRMFPVSNSSQSIIDCLISELNRYGVSIRMNTEVKRVNTDPGGPAGSVFNIQCANDEVISADYICVAAGGYPKSVMFDWLRELGHTIEDPVPSLFTFNLPGHPITELMGVSVEMAKVRIAHTRLEQAGPVLITHWGLSGPAILRTSAWGARQLAEKKYEYTAHINWLYGLGYNEARLQDAFLNFRDTYSSHKIVSHNFGQLPQRLWQFLLSQSGVEKEMRFADLPKRMENTLIQNLVNYTVQVKGKTAFKEEFVTAGGVKLNEVDPNTMMSRKIPNLYFAGEILDVDGITGGFNFQHAWTSGFVAARSLPC